MELGTKVKIVDTGYEYSSYKEKAQELGLIHWKNGRTFNDGIKGYVVAQDDERRLAVMTCHGVCLIHEDGVKIICDTCELCGGGI